MKKIAKKFRGNWELVKWIAEFANGQSVHPFGADAIGRISYDKRGYMAVQVRNFEFVEDRLILSTDFIGPTRYTLTWKKL